MYVCMHVSIYIYICIYMYCVYDNRCTQELLLLNCFFKLDRRSLGGFSVSCMHDTCLAGCCSSTGCRRGLSHIAHCDFKACCNALQDRAGRDDDDEVVLFPAEASCLFKVGCSRQEGLDAEGVDEARFILCPICINLIP